MSGKVNQVGARSGVITAGSSTSAGTVTLSGTTGMVYEEGTWTPNPSEDSINSWSQNRYTRIGGYCFMSSQLTNIQGGFAYFNGLPFTTRPSGTAFDCVLLSGIMTNGIDFPSGTGDLSLYLYNNNVYIYAARDDSGWTNVSAGYMDNNEDIIVAFAYECQ